jgi:putative intracellular protease/amidase
MRKVLVITSSSSDLQLQSGKKVATGFFLSELIVPVQKMRAAGFEVHYANPSGTEPSLDPFSDRSVWFSFRRSEYEIAKRDLETEKLGARGSLHTPFRFDQLSDKDLNQYDALYIPGGHAPLMDLTNNPELGRIILHFHNNSKPTGIICHGPVALMSTRFAGDGKFAYSGYKISCYSNLEEKMNEYMWWDRVVDKMEDQLRKEGAVITNRWPMFPNVVIDRELISAQGPTSVWRFGDTLVREITRRAIES